jgi:hypothetical protein
LLEVIEIVKEALLRDDRALSYKGDTIFVVLMQLKNTVPMLRKVYIRDPE